MLDSEQKIAHWSWVQRQINLHLHFEYRSTKAIQVNMG